MNQRILKFRAWDGTAIIKSDDWPNLSGFFGTRNKDEIIMQFTGLLDKFGKEIYEGDIVQDENKTPREVKYDTDNLGVMISPFGSAFFSEGVLYPANCEIIGNIYENPNLIREDEI